MCAPAAPVCPEPALRVVLELFPRAGYRGVLTVVYPSAQLQVQVPARLGKLLLLLAGAWRVDADKSEPFRGMRSAEYIAARWKRLPDASTVSPATVRSYAKDLRGLVVEKLHELEQQQGCSLAEPELIFGARGYRLGHDRTEIVGFDLSVVPWEESSREYPTTGPRLDR